MIASTSWVWISEATSASSPVWPTIGSIGFGSADANPVDRLSSTTTFSPASTSSWTVWLPM
jgi:hypothetical protein